MSVTFSDLQPTLRAISQIPKDLQKELRQNTRQEIAVPMARKIQIAAGGQGRQAQAVAKSVRAASDRIPTVRMGGPKRITRGGAQAGSLLYGTEFGGGNRVGMVRGRGGPYRRRVTRQFGPHLGRVGRFIYPTLRREQPHVYAAWLRMLDRSIASWGKR